MNCSGRVYKGDLVIVSIPFDVSGYTDLSVSYFTTGDTKIVRDESGLTIEDGFITSYFEGHDLDLLPDGVLRFTLQYKVDDVDFVDSSNTMLYLKTPASYSAKTEDEVFEDGFDSGYTAGIGECEEMAEEAFDDGYVSGHTDGVSSGYSAGFVAGVSDTRSRMASTAITSNGVYERTDGFNHIDVQVPLDTPCDIEPTKSINLNDYYPYFQATVVPSSGYAGLEAVAVNGQDIYARGVNDVANQFVTLSATTNGTYLPQSEFAVFKEVYVNVDADCSSAITEAYQSGLTVGYNSGYTAGQADCPACTASTVVLSGTFTTTQSQTWTLGNADESRVIGWDWIANAADYPYGANTFIDGVSIDDIYFSLYDPGYFTIPAGNHTFVCNASSMSSFAPSPGIVGYSLPYFMINDIQNLKYGLFVS